MSNTYELAHVGINNDNAEQAQQLAQLLCMMFNLEPRAGQKSEFAGGNVDQRAFDGKHP